jgi:hypothetical protein
MSEGTYNGSITITDSNAANSPQSVDVTLTVSKQIPPEISVTPTSLTFSGKEGGSNPSSQSIRISNSGEGTLSYSITDDANWLSVSPDSGTSTGGENGHTVSVNTGGLSNGTYTGTITISSSNASNSPQNVNVTLTISEKPPPAISVTPTSLTFSGKEGGSNPSSQSIRISNSGEGTLSYSITDDANWLSVSPDSGTSTGGENSHTVSVNISGIGEGSYTGSISISDSNASNSPQTVSVALTISKDLPPEISVSLTSLEFSAEEGGSNPSSKSIGIRNSGQQTLNYTISDDAAWLSVSPGSGSSTGGENSHTVSVDISGLGAGDYTGEITITDSNASNSPQTVSVTLTISEPPPPEIWVSPSSLNFSAMQGGSNPSSKTVTIKNTGGQVLNYSISVSTSDGGSWLNIDHTNGSLSPGQEEPLTVSVDINGKDPGDYSGTITVIDTDGAADPKTVDVTLRIDPIPSDNKISVSLDRNSGGSGTEVTITISIDGNVNEIKAFGLYLHFDEDMFEYVDSSKGSLTGDWGIVAANEESSGKLNVGGAKFSGTTIPKGSSGSLISIKLKVTCSGCSDGQQSQICIDTFTDDITGMISDPGCVTFTYNQ